MILTRANAEAVLVGRTGPFLEATSLAITVAGSNADLNDSLRRTLTMMGLEPAALTVADTDLADLDTAMLIEEFLDRCELRVLETCQGRLADPSLMVEGLIQVQSADIGRACSAAILARREAIRMTWGEAGTGSKLGAQSVSLGFTQPYTTCD